ncbi:MAG: agl cluster protein AglQ [Nitrospirae bacterium]|nr:agl cluster protein AglQ [Nitrospirota bacterium]
MFLSDIIMQSSRAALQLQLKDGSFPPGFNGPYHDPETSARNTAHWLITMLKAYEISSETRFEDSAWRAVEYLISPSVRPMNASFYCRKNPEKDLCNGLMGQAWIIEALAIAGMKLEDPQFFELARNVFMMHPFDHQAGLWRRVNVDGSYNSFDMTFNHQLWFAAVGALLSNSPKDPISLMIIKFLDCALESHLSIDRSGRIIHMIKSTRPSAKRNRIIESISFLRSSSSSHKQMADKEIGYHAFNMYAFAMLKQYMPEHPLWQSNKFLLTLEFINKAEFINGLENNLFGYFYNVSGIEAAYAIQSFRSFYSFSRPEEWWVLQQIQRCYDTDEKMMNRSTEDKATLSARLYEATRLEDMEVNIT